MSYFERLIVNMLTFISLSVLLPQMVHVQSLLTALLASFVLSILNLLIKPILTLLSLPLTILTMGLFSFLINAVMLQMTSSLVGPDNFGFSSFGASLLVAVIMSVVNLIVTDHNMRKYVK
ncbi:phage holin family protein [Tetragenococcus halophilus]|uniref:phage holin family protein n=1 Tax=Tetragenococcus halophilus TaxID=51669 RepID=UPI000CC31A5F|nr:phage holin family protein [Tetragenococcus halophilus]RQD33074.1 phage holin family protein [Tetragenococcus halophilus subsp. halophilus DSM 20339]GBD60207.1 putative uncharacterized protein [Tetragenococcus halophilus subsp. halophilus]GMA43776.1 membrane protein [Tetragenococcus halophilus subsp. halophilus DSM 20339]